ncbi:MAG: class I SAM-dependent methyltransferase [Nanoarchaeota archaeon]|nr:class I SAM-dependent methyltransferase [Nanoarchaeota archaeon]
MNKKMNLFGRERICASFMDPKISGKTLNIGAGEVLWIENQVFLNNKNLISSDIDSQNLGLQNKAKEKIVVDATAIPFPNAYLSQLIILDVLEHIKDHEKAVKEIARVLRKKGRLVVCVPNDTLLSYLNPVRYVQHERHYKIKDITNILKRHGFKIEKVFAGGGIFELLALYIHFIVKYTTGRKINFLNKLRDYEYRKHNTSGNEIAILSTKL